MRRRIALVVASAVTAVAAVGGVQSLTVAPASAQLAQNSIVSAVPITGTPNAVDGRTYGIAEVGNTIVMGGSFTSLTDAKKTTTYAQKYVVAFDKTTGAVNTAFAPVLDKQVETVEPGPVPGTVYVGGDFNYLNGVKAKGLILLNVADGSRVTTFKFPAVNGVVQRVRLSGSRLYVGGTFTKIGPNARGGLVSVNATTGADDGFVTNVVTERHSLANPNSIPAAVGVFNLAVSPDGTKLVAVGNFRKVDGISRDQIVMLDLTTPTATVMPTWHVRKYEPLCSSKDDTYVRDVDFSPDGGYIVVAAVGSAVAGTLCDSAARFEVNVNSDDLQPTWTQFTGGDSVLSVAITGSVVYIAGHFRWVNNPAGKDRPTQGALPRPALAALDPATGLPFAWNPGRNPRGAGTYSLLATSTGLWMGSDTDWIGDHEYFRGKIAFFPLSGGTQLPALVTPHLPGGLYIGGAGTTTTLQRRSFDGTTVGASRAISTPGIDWSVVRGAFVLDDTLFYGKTDMKLHKRSFVGGVLGPEVLIDPYNDPKWSPIKSGSGKPPYDTYQGVSNDLYGKFPNVTSMFYDNKRVYYTFGSTTGLFYRPFNSDGGALDATRIIASSTFPAISGGAFLDGGFLYYVSTNGNLNKIAWVNGAPSGTATVVSGPTLGGIDWRSKALFIGPATIAPTAAATVTCTERHCAVDGSSSSDSDGTIASYSWDFGDGTPAVTGATASHDYATDGNVTITLTVTDNDGRTAVFTKPVVISAAPVSNIAFRATASFNGASATPSVTVPASVQPGDAMILAATTSTATDQTAPEGWTQVATQASATEITTLWQRVAVDGDATSTVTVPVTGGGRVDLHLLAYSGTAVTNPVSAVTAADGLSSASHAAPATSVPVSGSWMLWYWADKSSTTTAWTAPAGTTTRDTVIGSGTAYISTLFADSGAPLPFGAVGAQTATTDQPALKATMSSIVLRPKPAGSPTANASVTCTELSCSADGTASTDDGSIQTSSWDFGDGSPAVLGATATHDYAAAGTYVVTLTVTDNSGLVGIATKKITTVVIPKSNIAFVGKDGFNGSSAAPTVTIPASVQAGNALILALSTATQVTATPPAGWTPIAAQNAGSVMTTTLWKRVAVDGDAGTPVPVTLSASTKVDLHVLAYSGTSATDPVTTFATGSDTITTASHTAPGVTVGTSGSWVLWFWADKSSSTKAWTAPAGVTVRDSMIGTGSAYVTTLIGDDNAPQAAAPVAPQTATTDVAAPKATTATLVLNPA